VVLFGGDVALATALLVATQGVVGGSVVDAGDVLARQHFNGEGMDDREGGGGSKGRGEGERVGERELYGMGAKKRSTLWSVRGLKGSVSLVARSRDALHICGSCETERGRKFRCNGTGPNTAFSIAICEVRIHMGCPNRHVFFLPKSG